MLLPNIGSPREKTCIPTLFSPQSKTKLGFSSQTGVSPEQTLARGPGQQWERELGNSSVAPTPSSWLGCYKIPRISPRVSEAASVRAGRRTLGHLGAKSTSVVNSSCTESVCPAAFWCFQLDQLPASSPWLPAPNSRSISGMIRKGNSKSHPWSPPLTGSPGRGAGQLLGQPSGHFHSDTELRPAPGATLHSVTPALSYAEALPASKTALGPSDMKRPAGHENRLGHLRLDRWSLFFLGASLPVGA